MTSEDFPTVQVDISNIKKEILGSRHKKRLLFSLFWKLFFDVWFQAVQVDLRLCGQG